MGLDGLIHSMEELPLGLQRLINPEGPAPPWPLCSPSPVPWSNVCCCLAWKMPIKRRFCISPSLCDLRCVLIRSRSVEFCGWGAWLARGIENHCSVLLHRCTPCTTEHTSMTSRGCLPSSKSALADSAGVTRRDCLQSTGNFKEWVSHLQN